MQKATMSVEGKTNQKLTMEPQTCLYTHKKLIGNRWTKIRAKQKMVRVGKIKEEK